MDSHTENRNKPAVVVAGRNYGNILTMTRALGAAGYDVQVVKLYKKKNKPWNIMGKMKPEAYSKYVTAYLECIVGNQPEKVISLLEGINESDERLLLIPVDDYTAGIIDENYDRLNTKFILPSVGEKEGEITRLMDKHQQKLLAEEFGLPVLSSWLIESEGTRFVIPEGVKYPCFVKPNVSMNSTKAKMCRCDREEELRSVLEKYAEAGDFQVLVEEFAHIKDEYSVLGVCTKDGVTAPGVFRVIEGGHRERKGVAVSGELVSGEAFRGILEKCKAFIKGLEYTGMFDVDLIETEDGQVYFIELNFRAGASMHVLTKKNINLPAVMADNLLYGKPIEELLYTGDDKPVFVSEKVLLEEYARNDVSLEKMRASLKEADVLFIEDEVDRKPYEVFKRYYPIVTVMRIPYGIKDYIKK